MTARIATLAILALGSSLAGCKLGPTDRGPESPPAFTLGATPALPAPDAQTVPTVQIAEARGWPPGMKPLAAKGFEVQAFATGLAHPRWLHVLPNGDVLVAETAAPPRPEEYKGLKGKVMKKLMEKAGSVVPSANRISLLRDADGDGVAELRTEFLTGLNSPFGMALVGDQLFVANTDAIVKFTYSEGATSIDTPGTQLTDLPAGDLNHHWTKNIIANADGSKLYATVGSNSNAAENGLAVEDGRAAIWEVDISTGEKRLFATGLRNPNGLAWEPSTGALWTVVNERDALGDDLVPDYLTAVKDGAFYGWPFSYYGGHVDARVKPPRPDLVATARAPDYALGAHVAALGLAHSASAPFGEGMFIGQHGSWNRAVPTGYDVVFVPFTDGRPAGPPVEVLGGFVSAKGEAWGRPVGVTLDARGGLLVADDVGNAVWRVSARR